MPILAVTSVWNTGETGDINYACLYYKWNELEINLIALTIKEWKGKMNFTTVKYDDKKDQNYDKIIFFVPSVIRINYA